MGHRADPLHVSVEKAAALVPDSRHLVLPLTAGAQQIADAALTFLDE